MGRLGVRMTDERVQDICQAIRPNVGQMRFGMGFVGIILLSTQVAYRHRDEIPLPCELTGEICECLFIPALKWACVPVPSWNGQIDEHNPFSGAKQRVNG